MSVNKVPQIKYDVFVSFRGKDIRRGFLGHLIDILQRNKINVFVDDKLERGYEIGSSLVEGIKGSFISLIIFSQGYACSRWCLEELETILECKEKYGQIVIPIFYHVMPTDVRHQTGNYEKAFVEHEIKYKTKVQIWRQALNKSADLCGIESLNFRNDDELLKEIVKNVLTKLGKSAVNSRGLIGIDDKIADVELLIRREPKDTRLIGIWGMGGIGKTTLAEEVFKKLLSEYDSHCFIYNEREQSIKHGVVSLKKEIFSNLLADAVKSDTPNSSSIDVDRRIGRMKVLIVLDDVNDSDHIEKLLGNLANFGSGSRIIITSRDKQVLIANNADGIYRVGEFNSDKALELFKWYAFDQSVHQQEYDELSKRVVDYANGIPLVLKVLAHLLRGKNKQVWESELDKLKKMPLARVYDVMILSYNDLDRKEKQIFLDLACFFLRSQIKVNVVHLKSLLKDEETDNSVVAGLESLKDKALITFSEDNFVSMHDTLQEMAWEIVRRKSGEEDLGSHSQLWDPNDIHEALKNNKGTEATRSILIHLPTFENLKLSPHIFTKMNRLQFLEILGPFEETECFDQHIILAEGLQCLATELRFLYWYYYPLESLPENFSAEKLVILNLPHGRIKNLWHGVKNLVNLKEIDLSYCEKLEELPDLSKATNLEVLLLGGCSMLNKVHPSILSLSKLEKLNLWKCKSLTILTSNSRLCSLSHLNLDFCSGLTKFSLISENMKELTLRWTKIKAFPSSLGHQRKLKLLLLEGSHIEKLPSSIKNLMQLSHLQVSDCSKLQKIPKLPLFLETLDAKYCPLLQTLPKLPPFLRTLNVGDCESLQTLPTLPIFLETLYIGSCTSLQTLPELPPFLDALYATNCTSLQTLPELPPFLKILRARNCTSLKTVLLFPSTAVEQLKENRKHVMFWNCLNLDQHSLEAIELNAQTNVMNFANRHLSRPDHDDVENYYDYDKNCHSYQVFYVYPGSSVPEWLEYKTTEDCIMINLSSAPPSPPVGFIFSFILGKYRDAKLGRIKVHVTISDGEGEGKKGSVSMYIADDWYVKIESDHVCVMYDQRCSAFLNSRAKIQTRFKIHVTIVIQQLSKEFLLPPQQVFKGFGVSLISSSTYNSFIQQMELRDSMYQFH